VREFQEYTKRPPRAARRHLWHWSLPVGLVVVTLMLGVRVGSVPVPMEHLGYDANRGSEPGGTAAPGADPARDTVGGPREGYGGPLDVLVLGVDTRPPDSPGPLVVGSRSDTIMLVRIYPRSGEVRLLSIPRDLLVEVEPGVQDRINAAYAYGGLDQARKVVEDFTGIPVDRYAIVDFEGFSAAIDAIGGVEVNVEDDFPPKHDIEDGLQNLDGEQALYYARWRGTPGGDLDRIEHQQQLIAALRSKALDWDTVTRLPEIVKIMDANVQTDLGFREGLSLGRALISRGRNSPMTAAQLEGTPEILPSGAQVLVPNEATNEAILKEFRRWRTRGVRGGLSGACALSVKGLSAPGENVAAAIIGPDLSGEEREWWNGRHARFRI
jgi:polyisoprenyl-teichoic acid--peptidoglycan teichoic acid transferase